MKSSQSIRPIVVAVDGPAASGKSSVCGEAAQKIGWTTLNTGLIYRAAALVGLRRGCIVNKSDHSGLEINEPRMIGLTEELASQLKWDGLSRRIEWQSEDLTPLLSEPSIAQAASSVAKLKGVRLALLQVQRAIALQANAGIFVDGRDIGSVVFPDAELKIYLTASLDVRAKRRFEQLLRESPETTGLSIELIKAEIAARDNQDQTRENAPLLMAPDAVVFDTSHWDFQESVRRLIELVQTRNLGIFA